MREGGTEIGGGYLYVSGLTQILVHMWREEVAVRCLSLLLPTVLFETDALTGPEAHHFDELAGLQGPGILLILPLPLMGLQMYTAMLGFYIDAGDLGSSPHALTVSTLPPEPFPNPGSFDCHFSQAKLNLEIKNNLCKDPNRNLEK